MGTYKTSTLFQLEYQGTWFENIAVRSTGTLLVTRIDCPELWEIDPRTGTGSRLLTLPPSSGLTSLSGVTELSPDVFALGAAIYSMTAGITAGSSTLWTVDLSDTSNSEPVAKLVMKLPDIGLLNGMTTWDENTVLIADSTNGCIYRVSVADKESGVALEDESMTIAPNAPIPFGVNGVKVFTTASGQKYVYFTSTTRASFCRVPVNEHIEATGPVELVASGFFPDDFTILTKDGQEPVAYITTNAQNTVVKVLLGSGEVLPVAGDPSSLEVAGGTSCAFGRTDDDRETLYVATAGALAAPVNGSTEPAKVVAIKVE